MSSAQYAKAQVSYLVCKVYCQENGISIEYPDDHIKQGPSAGWFVAFMPSETSSSNLRIFVDSQSTQTPLVPSFNSYVDHLTLSNYLQNVDIVERRGVFLGGFQAYQVLYKYTSPSTGNSMTALDILSRHNGLTYTLSFIDTSADFLSDLNTIVHMQRSFTFLT